MEKITISEAELRPMRGRDEAIKLLAYLVAELANNHPEEAFYRGLMKKHLPVEYWPATLS